MAGRRQISHNCMVAEIPKIKTALNFFMNQFGLVTVVPKILNFVTFILLQVFIFNLCVMICPVVHSLLCYLVKKSHAWEYRLIGR
jgi:hypothetical protein